MSLFRILLMTLAAAALSGCDLVVSKTPLISPADTRGAVMPREGWWVRVDDTCWFDVRKPVRKWPRCVDSALFRPAVTAGFSAIQGFNTELGAWESYPFLITPGDPQLVQYEDRRDGWSVYYYYGLKPVMRDNEGRMTEALIWFAQCKRSDVAISGEVAQPRLPPGLSPDGETDDCIAADVATVRAAVVASRGPDDMRLRWARDARPDDFAK